MVVFSKKNGKPRRTVDFQALNLHATCETHHTQCPFHQAHSVLHRTRKTIFDAWNSYHSVPLHVDDCHITTFITPWGHYCYCPAPQGYITSGNGFTCCHDDIIAHIPQKTVCIDDSLLWSNSIKVSVWQVINWLDIYARNGITSSLTKFVFASDTVEFAGFQITLDSITPCQRTCKPSLPS